MTSLKPTLLLATGFLAIFVPGMTVAAGNPGEGKKTYDVLCMLCHGLAGRGDGPASAAIDPPPRNFTVGEFKFDPDKDGVIGTDEDLFAVIKKGGAAFGGNPVMVSWAHLSDGEVVNLIAYIRTLKATSPGRD